MKPSTNRILACILACSLAAGCTMGPKYKRPAMEIPGAFRGMPSQESAGSIADRSWWEIFDDPNLQTLIDEGLRNGYDARVAAARVEEYRMRMGISRSQLFPQADAGGEWQRGRSSDYTYPPGEKPVSETYIAQGSFYWEIDLWGRLRKLNEAGRAQYLATEEARYGVMLSLVSDVASSYYELCELDLELEIAKNTAAAYQGIYDLFNMRLEGGTGTELQTSSAEGALGNVSANVPTLEAKIAGKENALCLLVGRMPGPITRSRFPSTEGIPSEIPAGLPSALLERRPDVRQAEQNLVAFNANIGASKAAMFPALTLTGMYGGISPEVQTLFTKGSTWNIAPGLFQPLFHGGALRNQYRASKAQFEQAKAQYEKAVTCAFAETSSALISHRKLIEAEREQARSVRAYREAVRIANVRYVSGLSSYYEVLTNMQYLYPAEMALAKVQLQRATNYVDLFKALGGGWKDPGQARRPEAKRDNASELEPQK